MLYALCPLCLSIGRRKEPPLCKWEKICKQIGTACRDGGIVFLILHKYNPSVSFADSSPYTGEPTAAAETVQSKSFLEPPAVLVVFVSQKSNWESPCKSFPNSIFFNQTRNIRSP